MNSHIINIRSNRHIIILNQDERKQNYNIIIIHLLFLLILL